MAKKLQGITIEIDGNTTGLTNALKDVSREIYSVSGELSQVNKLLKLDPGNTELIAQKQELLAKAISDTSKKLETLKEAKAQADERIANGSEEGASEGYRELVREIAKTEQNLASLSKQSEETGNAINDIGDSAEDAGNKTSVFADVLKANLLSEAIKKGIQELANGMKQLANSIVGMGKQAFESYAQLEQLQGGVKKLFGDEAAATVKANANKAFKTIGINANEYMETVTAFSANLISSLGGNTEKAAGLADQALQDMADNASIFGTSMEEVSNVYKALAKGQYSTLDNLKLGYAGSKAGMQQLIDEANAYNKTIGKNTAYQIDSYADIVEAIHTVQEAKNIQGNAEMEANETITGTINSLKASYDNLLTSVASGQNLEENMNALVESLGNVATQVIPVIKQIIATIAKNLPTMIKTLLPEIAAAALDIFKTLSTSLLDMLPELIQIGIDVILSLVQGIAEALPELVPAIINAIVLIIETLINNLDKILDTIIDTMMIITETLIDNIPLLIQGIIKIVVALAKKLTEPGMIEKLIKATFLLMGGITSGLIMYIPELLKEIPGLITKLADKLKDGITKIKDVGKELMQGLWNGIKEKWENLKNKVSEFGEGIVNKFKSVFGIHSPSKVFKDEIGKYLAQGIGVGIEDEIPNTINQVNDAMADLTSGIQASVNPTINPTANSNPLIIQIENFNNKREQDIQALAEELEFYRKMTATAKGGK